MNYKSRLLAEMGIWIVEVLSTYFNNSLIRILICLGLILKILIILSSYKECKREAEKKKNAEEAIMKKKKRVKEKYWLRVKKRNKMVESSKKRYISKKLLKIRVKRKHTARKKVWKELRQRRRSR